MKTFTLLIKPSGSDCNLDCSYCFYKDRPAVYGTGTQRMPADVLEKLVKDYMQTRFDVVGFAWQGGEPTLMGVDFYRRAVQLQKKFGTAGQQISNKMQTNAVLLDENWCRFLHDNRFLLGISIDGPREFHDRHRLDHSGTGSYARTMRGIELCKAHHVQFNALVVLNSLNVQHPDTLFQFLLDNDISYIQFIPCLETDPRSGQPTEFSITPEQYGRFLCRTFDLWLAYGPEKLNIRQFDSLVTYCLMGRPSICAYSKQCSGFLVIEHNGDAFCCEFFVEPQWRLGNILQRPLVELANDPKKRLFARNKAKLPSQCLMCDCLDLCRGGCVKDRVRLGTGQPNTLNYFCQAYKQFFNHAMPVATDIAAKIESGTMLRHTRKARSVRLTIE